jgi:hypothetical protein
MPPEMQQYKAEVAQTTADVCVLAGHKRKKAATAADASGAAEGASGD